MGLFDILFGPPRDRPINEYGNTAGGGKIATDPQTPLQNPDPNFRRPPVKQIIRSGLFSDTVIELRTFNPPPPPPPPIPSNIGVIGAAIIGGILPLIDTPKGP